MALTEKGRQALGYIQKYFSEGEFCAKELSNSCGVKVAPATLTAVANQGFLEKLGGSPVQYKVVDGFTELMETLEENKKSGATNTNLCNAKKAKNDEFYTRYEDIEAEVMKYRKQFQDKVVYLPCDDPAEKKSEFWSFFVANFESFGLKKLIATHYEKDGQSYKDLENKKMPSGIIDKGKIVNKTGNIMVPYISEDGRTAVTIRNGKVYFGEDSGLNIASSEKISQVANITSTIQNAINSTMTKLSDSNCLYNGSNLADFVRTNFNNN